MIQRELLSNTAPETIKNRIRAAMFGHAIGDALGVPVEFCGREELRADPVTGYRGYGSHHVPAGTWSDDTSMALAALDSLSRGLDDTDMIRRFCDWKDHAAYTATDRVFDMGITTRQALSRFQHGVPALDCGLDGERENGNGSLMRIIPTVLYCQYHQPQMTEGERMEIIHRTSCLTHRHLRSQMGCGIYAFLLWALLEHPDKSTVQTGLDRAKAYYTAQPEFHGELQTYHRLLDQPAAEFARTPESSIKSSGYVVATLEAAVWCLLNTDSYAACVLQAVNLGSDTDTVAAVAGGLSGCLYGMAQIPAAWYDGLIRREMIETLCDAFAASLECDE